MIITKPSITFSAHFLMTVASSETTRSTHFKLGSLSFTICFFTMASKAISGVKSPVLGHTKGGTSRKTPRDSAGHTPGMRAGGWGGRKREREGDRGRERNESQLVSDMHGGVCARICPGSCFGSKRHPGSQGWTWSGFNSGSAKGQCLRADGYGCGDALFTLSAINGLQE